MVFSGAPVIAAALLLGRAAAFQVAQVRPTPDSWRTPGINRRAMQASEVRNRAPMLESEACAIVEPDSIAGRSEWSETPGVGVDAKDADPQVFYHAGIGARRRMYELGGMEYQLFLPDKWSDDNARPWPVVVYHHSYGERKWRLMNSESLPRLLARNQSTSFSSLQCWCINKTAFENGNVMYFPDTTDASVNTINKTEYSGPMASCSFADNFEAIAIMPKAIDTAAPAAATWTDPTNLNMTKGIVKFILENFNGDADRVVVTGTAEGASGALALVKENPELYSALILTDPTEALDVTGIDHTPVVVTGDKEDGELRNDALVAALKGRASGAPLTKYQRFVESPTAADPLFRAGKHTGDLVYRNPKLWEWAFSFYSGQYYDTNDYGGVLKWGLPQTGWINIGYNPTRPPATVPGGGSVVWADPGAQYNPTRPPLEYGYNPTRPPIVPGYNPTRPPVGYNPTRPPR